jgi:hypothetical protein
MLNPAAFQRIPQSLRFQAQIHYNLSDSILLPSSPYNPAQKTSGLHKPPVYIIIKCEARPSQTLTVTAG